MVCAPGNGGIAQIARCVPVDLKNLDAMVRVAEAEQPGLTIVGPELPLSLGIVDALQERGFRVFGPDARGRHAGDQQGLCQAFLAAAQHSHSQLMPSAPRRPSWRRPSSSSIRRSWSRQMGWQPARA